MKLKNILIAASLLAAFAMHGCQSMEDTYAEWTGDGKIRYVGKCEGFTVTAGWKRFVFEWTKSPDPMVKTIRIVWKTDDANGSYDIPATESSFATDAIFDESQPYTIECYGVDAEGNLSLPLTQYARPFTETHELVTGFPKMVNKYFFIDDNAILFLDAYMPAMRSSVLSFFRNGELQTIEIDKEMFDATYLFLEDIDTDRDVVVDRVAEVEGCIDPVTFAPYALDRDFISLNYDFMQQIKDRYNLVEVTPEFINNLEVLEIDHSITSLEDILYFTGLREIVLGGNRYMVQLPAEPKLLSTLRDIDRSVYAFDKIHDILGADVKIYNDHFSIGGRLPYAAIEGNPILPELAYLDTTGWTVEWSANEGTEDDYPANPERILDNDPSTLWAPGMVENRVRTHEITIDMQSERTLHGFKVTQGLLNTTTRDYYPDRIHIEVSNDGYSWKEAFYQTESIIGTNYGESTVLRMPEAIVGRYVRVSLVDKITGSSTIRSNSCLGDFMPF